jgi:hypothetical protein
VVHKNLNLLFITGFFILKIIYTVMKYIKYFESHQYYDSITEDFFYFKKNTRLDLTQEIIEKISSQLDSKWDVEVYENKLTIFRRGKKKNSLFDTLIFLSDDEWYFLRLGGEKYKCYKCDQFDGLIALLKDLKLIII